MRKVFIGNVKQIKAILYQCFTKSAPRLIKSTEAEIAGNGWLTYSDKAVNKRDTCLFNQIVMIFLKTVNEDGLHHCRSLMDQEVCSWLVSCQGLWSPAAIMWSGNALIWTYMSESSEIPLKSVIQCIITLHDMLHPTSYTLHTRHFKLHTKQHKLNMSSYTLNTTH